MKHLKTFESFSKVNEELFGFDLKGWVNKHKDAVNKFITDLKLAAEKNSKLKEKLEEVEEKSNTPEGIKASTELVNSIPEEAKNESFKSILGGTMKWLGIVSRGASVLGIVGTLVQYSLADDGLIEKAKVYIPGDMPIGVFIAYCCAALVGGLILSKLGQKIAK